MVDEKSARRHRPRRPPGARRRLHRHHRRPRGGGPGSRAQTFAEARRVFRVDVDADGSGRLDAPPRSAAAGHRGGPGRAPGRSSPPPPCRPGEPFRLLVRAVDAWGNPAHSWAGHGHPARRRTRALRLPQTAHDFGPGDGGVWWLEGCTVAAPGLYRIEARASAAPAARRCRRAPIRCAAPRAPRPLPPLLGRPARGPDRGRRQDPGLLPLRPGRGRDRLRRLPAQRPRALQRGLRRAAGGRAGVRRAGALRPPARLRVVGGAPHGRAPQRLLPAPRPADAPQQPPRGGGHARTRPATCPTSATCTAPTAARTPSSPPTWEAATPT